MVGHNRIEKYRNTYSILVTLLLICVLFVLLFPSIFNDLFSDHYTSLTIVPDNTVGLYELSNDQLGDNCTFSVAYYNVSDVHVTIGKKTYPLETAIHDGLISIEEIIAQAQLDCRDRSICREKYTSTMGCATYIYQYNTYDIVYRYDVFECSDGQTYLMKDVIIAPFDQGRNVDLGFGLEYANDLLFEDWGLSFKFIESTPEYIKFACAQSDGQHADKLVVEGYWLDDSSENVLIPFQLLETETSLLNNDTTTVMIDWPESFGTLDSGDYKLYLHIREQYSKDDIHSLQKNYTDWQTYLVEFSIP